MDGQRSYHQICLLAVDIPTLLEEEYTAASGPVKASLRGKPFELSFSHWALLVNDTCYELSRVEPARGAVPEGPIIKPRISTEAQWRQRRQHQNRNVMKRLVGGTIMTTGEITKQVLYERIKVAADHALVPPGELAIWEKFPHRASGITTGIKQLLPTIVFGFGAIVASVVTKRPVGLQEASKVLRYGSQATRFSPDKDRAWLKDSPKG